LEVTENKGEEEIKLKGFSKDGRIPNADIRASVSIPFEIVVGCPANGELFTPTKIPAFVRRIIETRLWLTSAKNCE
jgi:hypothetical protein